MLEGACHCGRLTVRFETARTPSDLPVRTCGCSFCIKHRPRYTSDPAVHITFQLDDEASASRYRFGLRLADFLICRTCGVFVGAFDRGRAVINLDVLARAPDFSAAATQFTYDSEDVETRSARRAANWTPATIEIALHSGVHLDT